MKYPTMLVIGTWLGCMWCVRAAQQCPGDMLIKGLVFGGMSALYLGLSRWAWNRALRPTPPEPLP